MRPKLLGLSGIVLLLTLGCQRGPWQNIMRPGDRHQGAGPSQPDLADIEPEPEPKILPKTYLAAGELAETRGDLAVAVSMYRKAVALDQDFVKGYSRLGLVLDRLGYYKQANEALATAVELAPDRAYLRNNLAYSYILQRRWSEAEAELRVALELQPEFARARINLGVVLAQTGRYEQAIQQFLLVLPPASAHYNLGLMYEMSRRYEQARAAFTEALALDPRMGPAREGLKRIAMSMPSRPDLHQHGTGLAAANQRLVIDPVADAEELYPEPGPPLEVSPATDARRPAALEPGTEAVPASIVLTEPEATQRVRERRPEVRLGPDRPEAPDGPDQTPPPDETQPTGESTEAGFTTPDSGILDPMGADLPGDDARAGSEPSMPPTEGNPIPPVEGPIPPDELLAGPVALPRFPAEPIAPPVFPVAPIASDESPTGPTLTVKARMAAVKTIARLVSKTASWWNGVEGQGVRLRLGRLLLPEIEEPHVTLSVEAPPLLLPPEIEQKNAVEGNDGLF